MSDEPVKVGEEVITSGGDRIFPKGLPIGTVASVEPGKDLFLNIRVIPSARLDRLEEVLVVTKIQDKLPDAKDLGPIRASDILSERLPGVPAAANVDAAGNASNPAGGVVNPAPSGAAPGAIAAKPGASASNTPPLAVGAAASTAKPSAGAVPGSPRTNAVPSGNSTTGGANAASTPKVVRKPPVTVPSDASPKQPVTPPATQENPPQ
jgi:rod shape-determining protein MreC